MSDRFELIAMNVSVIESASKTINELAQAQFIEEADAGSRASGRFKLLGEIGVKAKAATIYCDKIKGILDALNDTE